MAQRFKAKTLISNSGVFNNELTAPNLVYNTGNQNISGVKTFATGIIAPNLVYNTGDQTISGIKAFSDYIQLTNQNNGIIFNNNGSIYSTSVVGNESGITLTTFQQPTDIVRRNNFVGGNSDEVISILNANTSNIFGQSINGFSDQIVIYNTGLIFGVPSSKGPYLRLGDNNIISEKSASKLGIGTLFPSEKVHISGGNLKVEGDAIANNLIYNTGNQNISGQKRFADEDIIQTFPIAPFGTRLQPSIFSAGHPGPGNYFFVPRSEYRPVVFPNPNYYYSGVNTTSAEIYFNTGTSRWWFTYNGILQDASPIVTAGQPFSFVAPLPLNNWSGGNMRFAPVYSHNISHYSDGADPINPILINAVAITGGNQTISGVKAFDSRPTVNGTGVLLSGEAAQVDLTSTVRTTGDQQISGIKTFNDPIYGTTLSGLNLIGGVPSSIGKDILISGGNATSFAGGSISIVGGIGASIYPSGTINLRGSSVNITTSTVDFRNSLVANASAGFTNVNSNFTISAAYGSDLVLANSSSQITGTISSGLANGFNVSIHQIGSGQIVITGAGTGVVINSYGNQYKTAGQYAAISLVHTGNNGYLMYGNTAL